MASTAVDFNQWKDTFKRQLPAGVRAVFEGGSKRELLRQIGVTLLVFDNQVVNLASGQQVTLEPGDCLDSNSLASACHRLVATENGELSILLLLPSDEFVATTVAIPGLGKEALASALQLQSDILLPSLNDKLLLAVNPLNSESGHADIALWIGEDRLENLFQSFAGNQMFLTSVMPRTLALADEAGNLDLIESDDSTMTYVVMENGALTRWLHVNKTDLDQDIFAKQWQQQVTGANAPQRKEISGDRAVDAYKGSKSAKSSKREYHFFPTSALRAKRQVEKGKRVIFSVAAFAMLIFVCALPFLAQSFEMRRLEANLDSQRGLSQNAREDRRVVQNFEDEWGLINDFPLQDVRDVMFTLQSVLSPEQLTSLELSEGLIRIEGESTEPQIILQRLEQHPLFTEVAFSRATNNSRYYIDLRLSTVNFDGYMVSYFPDN
ncbi:MAG: hypothetical protein JKY98_10970 [Gammaproteobacteria bacterium]|nr:hypothetical protein [Gammaproteobacteria bacterium]